MGIEEFSIRLGLAFILGALIGFERQWQQKSAGLRTNTLVSIGSAAFILLSVTLTGEHGDPSRVAAQIVTGIGFLGAGVIMKDGFSVQGLNTAATLWCSAAVGSIAGFGLFSESIIVAGAVVLSHLILRPLSLRLSKLPYVKKSQTKTEYLFTVKCKVNYENQIRALLMREFTNENKILLKSLSSDESGDNTHTTITAKITAVSQQDNLMERVASRISIEQQAMKVSWEIIGSEEEL